MRIAGRPDIPYRHLHRSLVRGFSTSRNFQAQSKEAQVNDDDAQKYTNLAGPFIRHTDHGPTLRKHFAKGELFGGHKLKFQNVELNDSSQDDIKLPLKPAQHAVSSRCRNRGVLLTGGTGGIGLAIAKRLVEEGAGRVVIISRNADRASEAITKIKEQTSLHDAPVSPFIADITATVGNNISQLLDSFPYCNTLINCAGIPEYRIMLKTSTAQQHDILNTNLHAPLELSKHFLSHYVQSRKRRAAIPTASRPPGSDENTSQSYCCINISSLLAYKAVIGTATYAAAKAGLIAHTRVHALEGSRYHDMVGDRSPFRANVVVPGYVETPMVGNFSERIRQDIEAEIPLHRFGRPEEVADAVVFLLANEYANNCVLNLDGGLSAS